MYDCVNSRTQKNFIMMDIWFGWNQNQAQPKSWGFFFWHLKHFKKLQMDHLRFGCCLPWCHHWLQWEIIPPNNCKLTLFCTFWGKTAHMQRETPGLHFRVVWKCYHFWRWRDSSFSGGTSDPCLQSQDNMKFSHDHQNSILAHFLGLFCCISSADWFW